MCKFAKPTIAGSALGRVCQRAASWIIVLTVVAGRPVPAIAQLMAVDVSESTEGEQPGRKAFVLPTQTGDITEALDDFKRYSKRAVWEKAFKALDKVTANTSKGLVDRGDGVMVPSSMLVRKALADLPPAGKVAYRVFHDPEAKALYEQAKGASEADKLAAIVSGQLITSVGDLAADRLGDLYFERGEYAKAADAWQAILLYLPESSLSRAVLLTKAGVAQARSGRWNDLDDTLRQLKERHEGESIELGGQKLAPAAHLTALSAALRPKETAVAKSGLPDDLELPKANEPLWQFRVNSKFADGEQGLMMMNPWGNQVQVDLVLPAAADDERVYADLLGYDLSIDLKTGKLLWRSGRYHDLSAKIRQMQYMSPERYHIALSGDRLWVVARDPARLNEHGSPFYLTAREKATGKELLNSKNVKELNGWNLTGAPLLVGDRVYICGYKNNQGTELHTLALSTADGKPQWTTALGTHQTDQNQMYYQQSAQPTLLLAGDKLYVDTHGGALVELDAKTGAIAWGATYESEVANNNYNYNQTPKTLTFSPPLLAGGSLFFKGMRSYRLVALNPQTTAMQWKRPVPEGSMVVGADDERIYLAGDEMTAYEIKTQKLLWASKIPLGTGNIRPLLTRNRIYQFTPRGIYEIDKTNGRVVRLFRGSDLESLGGKLLLTPHALLTVSNLAITAYPLSGESAAGESAAIDKPAADKPAGDKAVLEKTDPPAAKTP